MAAGKYHQLATLVATPVVGATAYALTNNTQVAGLTAAGCLFGLLVHPDRDLRVTKIDFDLAKYTLGLGLIWAILWWPYSSTIPHHRHWTSHLPIIGTAGRVFYMGLFLLAGNFLVYPSILPLFYAPHLWLFVVGLACSDALHWFMDGCPLV
jgi:uncharacterized metal-binding protein